MPFSQYTIQIAKEVLKILNSSEQGISDEEAAKRQKIYGLNEIKSSSNTALNILLRQFRSPFFYLLFAAGIVSLLIGEKIDGLVIFLFVAINLALGFYQEVRAERAVSLLKRYIGEDVKVLRDGREKIIDRSLLVPGDVAVLEAGNIAAADLRILKSENLVIDESVLSGESAPVYKTSRPSEKEPKGIFGAANIIFSGTSVINGESEAVVIATGKNTQIGEIANLTEMIKKESAYERNLFEFCRLILRIVVLTIVLVYIANLVFRGSANLFEFSLFSIALIVSIIPEALPTVVTFALSEGSLKLAKNKVVAKRLSAIEDLGDMEVLCTDKTGTLTENNLELVKTNSRDPAKCMLYALLASGFASEEIESSVNSFDAAIAKKADKKTMEEMEYYDEISELPFDSFRMRNSALVRDRDGNNILIVKGAPEILLKLSSGAAGGKIIEDIKKEMEKEGRAGRRTLGVAFKAMVDSAYSERDEHGLTFLGYFSFEDPLKSTTKETIATARKLGVEIKIITGDSKEVAGAVAKEIELVDDSRQVVIGEDLDSLQGKEFEKACEEYSVFARVSPKTKYKIIEALQKKFEVGFLGEGINDTPALKAANVAIAVRSASDVSREAADIILLEKDLKVIVNGIETGRNIFSNINKYIKCTLASNFGNFYSISIISLIIPYLPMLPIQILLVNLMSDFPLIAVATDKVDKEEVRKPKQYQLSEAIWLIVYLAFASTVFDFIFFYIFRNSGEGNLQTLWFVESILTEIFLIYSIRSRHFFLKAVMPSLSMLLLSAFTVATTIILPFTELGKKLFYFATPKVNDVLVVLALIFGYLAVSEIIKLAYFRHKAKHLELMEYLEVKLPS